MNLLCRISRFSSSHFEPISATIQDATGKSIDLDKASVMFKSMLSDKIQRRFTAVWAEMELSSSLEELKKAKEATDDEEKRLRPGDLTAEDQARSEVIKLLMKRKKILENQLNYQNRALEDILVPNVEQARATYKKNAQERQNILSEIRKDEADMKIIEQQLKEYVQ